MSLLACDQLTDADNSLRRLRYVLDKYPGTIISAGYCMGQLYQQVRTNHFQDLLDNLDGVMDKLRPLGIDAAPGYAMIALACFAMRQTDDKLLAQATVWWGRACLLMAPEVLVNRFDELKAIARGPLAAAQAVDGVQQPGTSDASGASDDADSGGDE